MAGNTEPGDRIRRHTSSERMHTVMACIHTPVDRSNLRGGKERSGYSLERNERSSLEHERRASGNGRRRYAASDLHGGKLQNEVYAAHNHMFALVMRAVPRLDLVRQEAWLEENALGRDERDSVDGTLGGAVFWLESLQRGCSLSVVSIRTIH